MTRVFLVGPGYLQASQREPNQSFRGMLTKTSRTFLMNGYQLQEFLSMMACMSVKFYTGRNIGIYIYIALQSEI